jgi:hypothetical protein
MKRLLMIVSAFGFFASLNVLAVVTSDGPPKILTQESVGIAQHQLGKSLDADEEELENTPQDQELTKSGEKGVESMLSARNNVDKNVFNQEQVTTEQLAKAQSNKNTKVIDEQQAPPVPKLKDADQKSVDKGVDNYEDSVEIEKKLELLPPIRVPVKHEGVLQN